VRKYMEAILEADENDDWTEVKIMEWRNPTDIVGGLGRGI
jgi:hypothetical protein